jgi:hypothetical protein
MIAARALPVDSKIAKITDITTSASSKKLFEFAIFQKKNVKKRTKANKSDEAKRNFQMCNTVQISRREDHNSWLNIVKHIRSEKNHNRS